ncbi:MAG TPA: Na+/H+ antiporter subunit E [Ilumatobacter sp.]|nr:Na+/H+ antiporter subunit E [Ilumatobacter sp.]
MTSLRISGIVVWLTALWVMLWRSLSVANVVSGVLVAFAVLAFARLPRMRTTERDDAILISPLAMTWLAVFVLYKLVEANAVLAWEIVTPHNRIRTGVIALPLRTESETAMMVVANLITLTPGTVTIESVGSPAVLYVHVLHLHDLERVRTDLLQIEALSVRAFGSRAARRQLQERIEP